MRSPARRRFAWPSWGRPDHHCKVLDGVAVLLRDRVIPTTHSARRSTRLASAHQLLVTRPGTHPPTRPAPFGTPPAACENRRRARNVQVRLLTGRAQYVQRFHLRHWAASTGKAPPSRRLSRAEAPWRYACSQAGTVYARSTQQVLQSTRRSGAISEPDSKWARQRATRGGSGPRLCWPSRARCGRRPPKRSVQ